MEEPEYVEMYNESFELDPDFDGPRRPFTFYEYVIQSWNLLCSLCLVLIILIHKKVRGNPNNWPMIYFGTIALLNSVFKMTFEYNTDIQIAKSIPETVCIVFQVFVYALREDYVLAQLFFLIDRLDWLANYSRHDKRMTPKYYGLTIAVLIGVGLAVSVGIFAGQHSIHAHYVCVNTFPPVYRIYYRIQNAIRILTLLAIFIAAPALYKKRPATDDNIKSVREAKETTIIVCIQSGVTVPLITIRGMTEGMGFRVPQLLYEAFIGLICLLMIAVFTKIRRA